MAGFSIDRKALYDEIWASSVTKVAEKHEISYSRLLSACKENNIPIPPSGYNTKREFGKPVQPIPLPEADNVIIVIEAPIEKKKEKQDRLVSVAIPFSISEGKDKIIHEITQAERLEQIKYEEAQSKGHYASKPNIPKYEHPWNGKLKISVAGIYDFADCKAYVLEDRIGEILIAFFEASYSARLRRLQEEEKRRKEHEEYLQRERIKQLYNSEVDKTNALLNKTADFEIACRIRRYIDAIKNDPTNPDNNPDWIDWASKKADWIDPTVARKDEFFGKRKHEQDVDQKELKRRW